MQAITFDHGAVGRVVRVADRDEVGEVIKAGINRGASERAVRVVEVLFNDSGLIATYRADAVAYI